MGAAPVADHHAVILPITLQNLVEGVLVLAAVLVLVEVVGAHDAPSVALLDGGLECGQINLAQGAVAHDNVHLVAMLLIVVQAEVLHTGRCTRALQALDVGHHHAGCQQRILAHVFEISAIQWRAVDVHARTQDHVLAAVTCFLTQAAAIQARQFGIPRGCQARQCREGHARVVGLASLLPLVPEDVGAHAVRSVVSPEVRHTQSLHARRGEFALCMDDGNLLIERHA